MQYDEVCLQFQESEQDWERSLASLTLLRKLTLVRETLSTSWGEQKGQEGEEGQEGQAESEPGAPTIPEKGLAGSYPRQRDSIPCFEGRGRRPKETRRRGMSR